MIASILLLTLCLIYKEHILGVTEPTPPSIQTIDRQSYKDSLKRLESEAGTLEMQVQMNQWDEHEEYKIGDKIMLWGARTYVWICNNMGMNAVAHFVGVGPEPNNFSPNRITAVNMWILSHQMKNIEDLIGHDTWDPEGRIVKPSLGCRSGIRGDPNDPITQMGDQMPGPQKPSDFEPRTQ